jgi:hypothetical protein
MPSVSTFGPVGRVGASLVVFVPEWLMFQLPWYNTILGRVAYLAIVVIFLRAIWAPVRLGRRDDHTPPPAAPTDWRHDPEAPVIVRREAPRRW